MGRHPRPSLSPRHADGRRQPRPCPHDGARPPHGRCSTALTGLTISNGIGWSPDGGTMYLNDSGTGLVEAFDFDGATGAIGGGRPPGAIDPTRPGPDRVARAPQGKNL